MKTRPRAVRRLSPAVCAAAALLLFTGTATTAASASVRQVGAGEVLALVDAERARAGCPALVVAPALTRAAQTQADDMFQNNLTGHIGSDDSTPRFRLERVGYAWRAYGENVSGPGYENAREHVAAWMSDPRSRHTLLHCGFTETGVAVSGDRVVQLFAAPR
ncbi:CAP domain-containing protein [Streptomyces subrutilus]|uniref:CAP domain-containing protein n=1 Tax=Streptomyces subrutilus TaxID=36818 RepID=A0A5P2UUB5_9ACTN|nr:CAP domain-containing protein [Streptomyces subrutilus]QEU81091.1 CAP domain-containing protein [Streptomyces subrutilus]WSJ29598.1 CAP domain-containing protein [Streptomyces subrutilus]GGZ65829.1 hypothetical protein GCM10010371_26840 [Streptomyces subrutilus]